jgi:hypothetical protein
MVLVHVVGAETFAKFEGHLRANLTLEKRQRRCPILERDIVFGNPTAVSLAPDRSSGGLPAPSHFLWPTVRYPICRACS